MHILLVHRGVIPVFHYGGTERVMWGLGKALVALGHRVSFLVPEGSSCDFAQVLALRDNVPWQAQVPADVDVVHFQFNPGAEQPYPHIVTEHGNSSPPRALPLNTVFVSRNHAARHGSDEYVLNGLGWADYGPSLPTVPRRSFHFLGKAAWRVKNVQGAIDVALRAGQQLQVLGGTRLNLKRGFRLTLSPRVHFHGMVGGQEKFSLLNASRGMIFPVRWHEPFGLAVIESMYFGCPVYATPYGALPEIVTADCGVLSASEDALAQAVQRGGIDAAACHARAIRHFSAERMARDYLVKYQRVLDGETLNASAPMLQGQFEGLPWLRHGAASS